jgi:hypothetical protein
MGKGGVVLGREIDYFEFLVRWEWWHSSAYGRGFNCFDFLASGKE